VKRNSWNIQDYLKYFI